MNKKIVHAGQSFLDKVIETTGNIENDFEMALLNGISITDTIQVGTELLISKVTNKSIEVFFDETNKPASGINKIAPVEAFGFPYIFPIQF